MIFYLIIFKIFMQLTYLNIYLFINENEKTQWVAGSLVLIIYVGKKRLKISVAEL